MRTRWARVTGTLTLVTALALVVTACGDSDGGGSSSSPPSSSPKTYQAGDSITVRNGATFVIALEANPTTGYSWSADDNPNVEYVSSRQVSGGNMPGAPGTQQLTFRATSPGSSKLVLGYSRPFEPDAPPAETESFPVTVRG